VTFTLGLRLDREEINSEGQGLFGTQHPASEFAEYLCLTAPVPELGGPACGQGGLNPNNNDLGNAKIQAFSGYEAVEEFREIMLSQFCAGLSGEDLTDCRVALRPNIVTENIAGALQKRQSADIDIANTNFSPSFAFSWSPWTNGKTVVKGALGRHYNHIPLLVPLQELNPAFISAVFNILPASQGDEPPVPGGNTIILEPRGSIEPAVSIQQVRRDLSTPFQDEITLAFEREIFTETKLSVRYINRKFKDQIQDRNINLTQADFGRCELIAGSSQAVRSPGQGQVTDPFTGETYTDTDPGNGDGRIDDCIGLVSFVTPREDPGGGGVPGGGASEQTIQSRDGRPDLYVINPFWGDIFEIGNYNQIDYEAFVFELVRRQYRSWEMQGSYTYSTAEGDGEDFFQQIGDDPSLILDEYGYQSYDQRHVVKVNATTITPWGIRLGGAMSWESGLPYSIVRQEPVFDAIPPIFSATPLPTTSATAPRVRQRYLTTGRNDQRNEGYWTFDVRATREMNLGKGLNMQVSAEVYNLFDEPNPRIWNPTSQQGFIVNGNAERFFLYGREWQLGLKLSF
jgi:hypothetical protein